jgi:hypothetical protein
MGGTGAAGHQHRWRRTSVKALSRHGPVLVAWEHRRIPPLVAEPRHPPDVPDWPDERFDLLWVFDRGDRGRTFSQIRQLLLPGDSADLAS